MQLNMVSVLPERGTLQPLQVASLQPQIGCLGDRDAGALRAMDAPFYIAPGIDEPGIGVLLPLEGLEMALAVLVEVVGHPCGFRLTAGFPGPFAYRRHKPF